MICHAVLVHSAASLLAVAYWASAVHPDMTVRVAPVAFMSLTKTLSSLLQVQTYGKYSATYFLISLLNLNYLAKYQNEANAIQRLTPMDMIMHLRELSAWMRLKLRSAPADITTP